MGSSPSKASPPVRQVAVPEPRSPPVVAKPSAVASVQTDDGWADELLSGAQSVPERLRAPTPSFETDIEVVEPPARVRAPSSPPAEAGGSSRPKSAHHRLNLMQVDTGASVTATPAKFTQGAVGRQKRAVPQPKARSAATLQLQQDTLGLGQQRGASSGDDVYLYEGNKTGVKWDDLHNAFASGLPTDYDSSKYELVHAISPFDPKKPQQTKGALAAPHELHNFRAFDAHSDAENFKNVDRHALDVATYNGSYTSFKHLCWALTGRGAITDDCERLRVLYSWFLCTDLFESPFTSVDPQDALDMNITQIIDDFREAQYIRSENVAKLFEQFCSYLKIRCRTLSGWARGGKSRIGRRLQSGSVRHTWNAVNIRNQWRVLDVAWGFEKLGVKIESNPKPSAEERLLLAREQLAFFYFLPNPAEFVWDHWCEEPAWQMLDAPVSLENFDYRAELWPGYFAFGFHGVPDVPPREIAVNEERLELSLKLAPAIAGTSSNTPRHRRFLFRAELQRESGQDALEGRSLNHYVALYRSDLQLICNVRPPVNGDYVLTLFGGLVHKDQEVQWSIVARFTLQVSGVAKCPAPFPCGSGLEYGPQRLAAQEALWTSKCESYKKTLNGVVSLRLEGSRVPKAIGARLLRLDEEFGEAEDLSHLSERWVKEPEHAMGANAHLPAAGEYLLELTCDEDADVWKKGEVLWRFLLDAAAPSPLAVVLAEDSGSGSRLISNETGSSIIPVEKPELPLQFMFDRPFVIERYQLRYHPDNGAPDEQLNHYAIYEFRQTDECKTVTFNLRFTKNGMYSLLVFSKLIDEMSTNPDLEASIAGYLFQYNGVAKETLALPYPLVPNVMGALGPTDWGRELLDLKDMSIQSAAQKLSSGQGFIEFDLHMKMALNAWVKMWRTTSEKSELEDVSNHVFVRVVGLKLYLSVCTPAKGEYVLALYGDTLDEANNWDTQPSGKKDKADVNTKCLIWRSLIDSDGAAKQAAAVSRLPLHAFGPAPVIDMLLANLKPERYTEPYVKTKEQELEFVFTVDETTPFTKPSAQLDFVDAEGQSSELGMQGWTFLKYETDAGKKQSRVSIKVRLPRTGFYVLSLFSELGAGTPSGNKKNSLVYSYLLEYEATAASEQKPVVKFPRQRRDWAEGFELLQPCFYELRSEDYPSGWVPFSVRLPGVQHAAVFVDRECVELGLLPDKDAAKPPTFGQELVGEAFLYPHFGKGKMVHVAAVLPGNASNAYTSLLTYQIV